MAKGMNFIDLFAGAGGLSEGFIQEGYEPIAHVESDAAACNTLRTRIAYHWSHSRGREDLYADYLSGNLSRDSLYSLVPRKKMRSVLNVELRTDTIQKICCEIDALLDGRELDLLVGGPPCQAYSVVGRARDPEGMARDERNYLYRHYARVLERYLPRKFVFENVVGLLSAKDHRGNSHLESIRSSFVNLGYQIKSVVLNAKDFGVLQNRKRLVLMGDRERTPTSISFKLQPKFNAIVKDALDDLPSILAGEGTIGSSARSSTTPSQWLVERKLSSNLPITWHQARPQSQRDLEIYRIAVRKWNKGQTRLQYDSLPSHLKTHRNKTAFSDRFKVVAGDLPFAHTVVAHICKDGHHYIHPDLDQNRSITPREAARLQSFPDNYFFEGIGAIPSRTSAFRQIGNAVPILLSQGVAASIRKSWNA